MGQNVGQVSPLFKFEKFGPVPQNKALGCAPLVISGEYGAIGNALASFQALCAGSTVSCVRLPEKTRGTLVVELPGIQCELKLTPGNYPNEFGFDGLISGTWTVNKDKLSPTWMNQLVNSLETAGISVFWESERGDTLHFQVAQRDRSIPQNVFGFENNALQFIGSNGIMRMDPAFLPARIPSLPKDYGRACQTIAVCLQKILTSEEALQLTQKLVHNAYHASIFTVEESSMGNTRMIIYDFLCTLENEPSFQREAIQQLLDRAYYLHPDTLNKINELIQNLSGSH